MDMHTQQHLINTRTPLDTTGLLDDAYTKPLALGWMFLPMKPYEGTVGHKAAAAFEPYVEHLQAYEFALAQYLGSGCGMT
jgi:hypothetical protein